MPPNLLNAYVEGTVIQVSETRWETKDSIIQENKLKICLFVMMSRIIQCVAKICLSKVNFVIVYISCIEKQHHYIIFDQLTIDTTIFL